MSITPRIEPSSPADARSRFQRWKETILSLSLSSGIIALLDQAVVSATNFGTNVAVGKSSSLDDLGVYTLAITLLYFCRGVQEQLVASPYTIYRQGTPLEHQPRYSGSSLAQQIVATAGSLVLVGIVAIIARFYNDSAQLASALSLMLLAYPVFMFREFFRKLAFAHFRFSTALIMDTLVIVLQLGSCAVLWWLGCLGSVSVFAAIAIASAVASLYWWSQKEVEFDFHRPQFKTDWLKNWRFSKWALCTFLMGCSAPFFMPWVVAFYLDLETTGLYFACTTLVGLANVVLNGICNLLGPATARAYAVAGAPQLWKTLIKALTAVVGLLVPFCFLVWFTGEWLPRLVLRDAAPDLRLPLLILAVQLVLHGIGTVAGNGLWAIDCPRLNLFADAALLVSTFGSAVYLVPHWGVTGAASSILIGSFFAAVLRWIAFYLQVGPPPTLRRGTAPVSS